MGYCIQDIVSWYQKKIGTYDKQQWEKTVEQRILSGFTHVPKKTAKLKTELIDVDLVRGSSFTKAKPKHGLAAVARFAVLRLVFLPAYASWWSQQTSRKLFALLLVLYLLQVTNICLFSYATRHLPEETLENVSASEVVVPAAMMLFLSMLHSEIVSPHSKEAVPCTGARARPRTKPRLKRRPRCSEYKSSVDTGSENVAGTLDPSSKFSKRLRPRKLSFEEGMKGAVSGVRLRRSVVWDTSPAKPSLPDTTPPNEEVGEGSRNVSQEDDGFESLNSNGSSDQSEEAVGEEGSIGGGPHEEETASRRNSWLQARRSSVALCHVSSGETDHNDSDTDNSDKRVHNQGSRLASRRSERWYNSSDDGRGRLTEGGTTSAGEWIGVTTNSDDCSDLDETPPPLELNEHPFASEFQTSSSAIPSPSCAASDKVSCTMWEKREVKKAELSVLDISSAIIARVEGMPENLDYFYGGMLVSIVLGLVPSFYRLTEVSAQPLVPLAPKPSLSFVNFTVTFFSSYIWAFIESAFGTSPWERSIAVIALFERTVLSGLLFFLVAVAERTFKQRFLYAKLFSHLTSFRRARKSELPHFRLNKVRNIKTWLSVRSYLKKRGPQHSVDVIVSSVFLITLLLLSFLSVELLKDSERLHSVYNIEALVWCIILGLFLLRFMTLGTKINRKYRNLSVLITEQINLYLQIEQKPNKKEELMVANSVLKLAADLLKELECPYKMSGLSANPYLYTITKVVILSALSGVLSEMLGFKLKLHKIKIK